MKKDLGGVENADTLVSLKGCTYRMILLCIYMHACSCFTGITLTSWRLLRCVHGLKDVQYACTYVWMNVCSIFCMLLKCIYLSTNIIGTNIISPICVCVCVDVLFICVYAWIWGAYRIVWKHFSQVYSDTKIRLHFSHFKILDPARETCFLDKPHQCPDLAAQKTSAADNVLDPSSSARNNEL